MPRTLDANKARELTKIVARLGQAASFMKILREAAAVGVLKEHKTLRRYLDLLTGGNVLGMHTLDVGSVYPQQLYRVKLNKPKVQVGLAALQRQGLNWDIPKSELRTTSIDFEGLVRSHFFGKVLMACLEDCIVHECYRNVKESTGTVSLIVAMLATRKLDLPYLLRRADEMHVGRAMRLALVKILDIVSKKETKVDASIFLAVRTQFLKIARQYVQSGFWKLVERKGKGKLGIRMIKYLNEHDIILAAGKQLGVTG
jgi:hypothetical protein